MVDSEICIACKTRKLRIITLFEMKIKLKLKREKEVPLSDQRTKNIDVIDE